MDSASTCALSPVCPKQGGMLVFDMPNITSIRVAKFEVRQGGAVYFLVEAVLANDSCWQWCVEKTFEQFVALHKTLVERHGIQQDLFPSMGKRQLSQLKLKMINQLQNQLDRYLASVLDVLGLPPRELLDFLDYKYTDVVSITRSLASFTYEHGDMILVQDKAIQITPLQLYCIKRRMVLPVASSETGHLCDDFGNLIDFVQKLHKMKVVSPPEHLFDASISNITFDLSLFKGLKVLGLEHVLPSQMAGMECMAKQLVTLEAHHCIQALKDILMMEGPGSGVSPNGLQWTHLTCANFAFNELEEIDASIKLLPCLVRLDLSYNAITKIENLSELSSLEVVDLSYNCIKSLQGASNQLSHAKELKLSHNHISCLDGIEIATLQCVDLSFNRISEENELCHLVTLASLVELHLHDNPISISAAYQSLVMTNTSREVGKLFLDGKEVSRGEFERISEHVHGKLKRVWSSCSGLEEGEKLYHVPSKVNLGEKLESFDVLKHLEKMREEGGERWLSMISTSSSPEGDLLPSQKHKKKKHAKKKHETSNKGEDVPPQPVMQSPAQPCNATPVISIPPTQNIIVIAQSPSSHQSTKKSLDDVSSKQPLQSPSSEAPLKGSEEQPLKSSTIKEPIYSIGSTLSSHSSDSLNASHPVPAGSRDVLPNTHDQLGGPSSSLSHEPHTQDRAHTGAQPLVVQSQTSVEVDGPDAGSVQSDPSSSSSVNKGMGSLICRPGLDSQELTEYFKRSVARDKSETLLAVEWSTSQLPACFLCQVATCLLVSDTTLYLMAVTARPDDHASWQSENLPLRPIVEAGLTELRQVTCAVSDQYLLFELSHRINMQHFVLFLPTSEHTTNVVANMKAALEALCVAYDDMTTGQRAVCGTTDNTILFVTSDDSDVNRLKCNLVRDRVSMESVNCTPLGEFVSIDSELDVKKASSKVTIVHYMVAWEMLSDLIPSSNGRCGLHLRALVMTQDSVYLCREDVLSRLAMESIPRCPSSLLGFVLDCHPISEIATFKECDRADLSFSPSNPLYGFSITFSSPTDDSTRGGSSSEWILCVQDSQPVTQLASSLSKAWCGLHGSPLPHVRTAITLLDHTPAPSPSLEREDASIQELKFYHNRALLDLCAISYDKKVEFFKERIALAKFDQGNETCVAFFMALCTPSSNPATEIEVVVIVSNYAVYIVSTHNNIELWCSAGGPCSVEQPVTKGKKKTPCCFHRMWLSDIKEVNVGLFYLSIQLNTVRSGEGGVAIVTQLAASTLTLLGAIAGAVDLKDASDNDDDDSKSGILAEFEDLGSHPIMKKIAGSKYPARLPATFRQHRLVEGDKLRYLLTENVHKTQAFEDVPCGLHVLGQQVMLFSEVPPAWSSGPSRHLLCLVLITSQGLYVCCSDSPGSHSPAVFRAQQLRVKKRCAVEQISYIEVVVAECCVKVYQGHTYSLHTDHKKPLPTNKEQLLPISRKQQLPTNKEQLLELCSTHIDQQKHLSAHSDQPKHPLTPSDQLDQATIQSGPLTALLPPVIHLIAQNSELLHSFLYHLSVLCSEKNGGKKLTVMRA